MGDDGILTLCAVALVVISMLLMQVIVDKQRSRNLAAFWSRFCAGRAWRKEFPAEQKSSIREFLLLLCDAFGFDKDRRLQFLPGDRLIDIYNADLGGDFVDSATLDVFARKIRERYSFDLFAAWDVDLTLGQIFEMTLHQTAQPRDRG